MSCQQKPKMTETNIRWLFCRRTTGNNNNNKFCYVKIFISVCTYRSSDVARTTHELYNQSNSFFFVFFFCQKNRFDVNEKFFGIAPTSITKWRFSTSVNRIKFKARLSRRTRNNRRNTPTNPNLRWIIIFHPCATNANFLNFKLGRIGVRNTTKIFFFPKESPRNKVWHRTNWGR